MFYFFILLTNNINRKYSGSLMFTTLSGDFEESYLTTAHRPNFSEPRSIPQPADMSLSLHLVGSSSRNMSVS